VLEVLIAARGPTKWEWRVCDRHGSTIMGGLNARDQQPGTGATERYFSCWPAAAFRVKDAEELEAPDRHEGVRASTPIANPQVRQPRGNGSYIIARSGYGIGRHSQSVRSGRFHREDLLDFETYGAVAFARFRREPRPVDLDLTPTIRSDRSGLAQIAHQKRYRRSPHAKYLRKRLLSERENVVVGVVAKME
jgi:hypothetical protein